MKKAKGFTLVELVTGAGLMMFITLGTLSLMVTGLTYMARSTADITNAGKNAQGLRWMSEFARTAMSATLANGGNEVDFVLPKVATTTDPNTGEKEYAFPLTGDGVARGFKVDFVAGTLTDVRTGQILCKNITGIDPDPTSTTYHQAYVPFTFSIVGAHKVIVMQLMTQQKINGNIRYERMKETVKLRNT